PELTGRENIFLNGSILGMKRSEIARNYAAIVEFSGVEKFIDTPVKRYSSGMFVRLAFSVAAHFEPEVMIVDEVLAVGDADFQRRSLVRLQSVRVVDEDGLTVTTPDVRRPVGIEIGFRVLKQGRPITPKIKVLDQHGAIAFNAMDVSPRWHDATPPGDYVATAWIPHNLLNEGRHLVD